MQSYAERDSAVLIQFRLSVQPSVRHTLMSCQNG